MSTSISGAHLNERLVTLVTANMVPELDYSKPDNDIINNYVESIKTGIAKHSERQQEAMVLLLEDDAEYSHLELLRALLAHNNSPTVINEYVSYSHLFVRGIHWATLLGALRHYPQLPKMDDYSMATGVVREQTEALITVAQRLISVTSYRRAIEVKTGSLPPQHTLPLRFTKPHHYAIAREVSAEVIVGDDLVQLIMDNPSAAIRIAMLILDRNTTDVEFIASAIVNASPAVADGVL